MYTHSIIIKIFKWEIGVELSTFPLTIISILLILFTLFFGAYMYFTYFMFHAVVTETINTNGTSTKDFEGSLIRIEENILRLEESNNNLIRDTQEMRDIINYLFGPREGAITPTSNIRGISGLTADDINKLLERTPIEGQGIHFIRAERLYGVDAMFLVALSAHESAYWGSRIARDKHNYFGWGAYDSNPYYYATRFESFEDCVITVAGEISQRYLSPDGRFYRGDDLKSVNRNYATDPNWAYKVASTSRNFESRIGRF